MKKEEAIHIAVCDYLRHQYPTAIFTSESAGVKLTMGQAVKAKKMRSSSKLPDIWILEPNNGYHGLLIELKSEYPFTKTGKPKSKHIEEQLDIIKRLKNRGYCAGMVTGFDEAKTVIDAYFTHKSE